MVSTDVSRTKEQFLQVALRVLTYRTCNLLLLRSCIIRGAVSQPGVEDARDTIFAVLVHLKQ